MRLGVAKETAAGETRVAATPATVLKMLDIGLSVSIETSAGLAAHFADDDYISAGASIVSREEALNADIVLKVQKPTFEQIDMMKQGAALVCFIDLCVDDGTLGKLSGAKVNAFALERIPRISRAQPMDALSSQSNIAGYRASLEAALIYDRFLPMMMTAAGSARPAKVIVLGAGVAGLQAIATTRRIGAQVEAFDVRPEVKEQVMSLGAKFIELDLGESGEGSGGYAKALSKDAQEKQRELLAEKLAKADVVISTAQIPCKQAPVLITEQAVKNMRRGSVIIDMAASTGGNCPLSEPDRIVEKYGVKIVGHTNYPALMPADASSFYAKNLLNFVSLIIESQDGDVTFKDFTKDEITKASLVTHRGAACFEIV